MTLDLEDLRLSVYMSLASTGRAPDAAALAAACVFAATAFTIPPKLATSPSARTVTSRSPTPFPPSTSGSP